jgi:hypothetical protein
MSAVDEVVEKLMDAGLSAAAAAALLARAGAEMNIKQPSKGAERTRRWRERRHQTSQSVTSDATAQNVTNVTKASPVTECDAAYISSSSILFLDLERKKERSKKEPASQNVTSDDWPSDYETQFWMQYPRCKRKHSRRQVGEKLARVRKNGEATWADVYGGLVRYVSSNPNPKYIPAPEVWVNKQYWLADFSQSANGDQEENITWLDIAKGHLNGVR